MKKFDIKTIFVIITLFLLISNSLQLSRKLGDMRQIREKVPYIFMGYKFSGLQDVLREAEFIGYYTDKSLDDRNAALHFAQAQYILAPVILDLNNTGHEYILFDCSSPEVTWRKIREAGLIPVSKNPFGLVLARNPAMPPSQTGP